MILKQGVSGKGRSRSLERPNDLQFDIGYVKFVDDTTTFSVSNDPRNCLLQKAAHYLVSWTNVNGMVINTSKTQNMVVYFGKQLC